MRALGLAAVLTVLLGGCSGVIQGHAVRESRGPETRRVGEILDPLLAALELPSLRVIGASDCKIGFAVVRTSRVNVWSRPATVEPCTRFTVLVTEGALAAPTDELRAMLAHELGHLLLRHTPLAADGEMSDVAWRAIQTQELEADRFAVALLKTVGSCDALGRFLRRGRADWYGDDMSPRMERAVAERVESADSACAADDVTLVPATIPVSLGR
jgi:Zn-dependent protease with chaperone function